MTFEELDLVIADHKRRLDAAVKLRSAMVEYAAVDRQEVAHAPKAARQPTIRFYSATVRPAPITQVTGETAARLMTQEGRPVTTGEIVQALRAAGVELPEHNASNVVSARMSNNREQFVGKRGIGWWFTNQPWPEHNHSLLPTDEAEPEPAAPNSATPLRSSQEGGGSVATTHNTLT